jgi:aminoglycoside phosphotransferase (APT) family kinase protein
MSTIQFNEFHDEAARKRLLAIAEMRTTPQDIVTNIIRSSIGQDIERVERIVRGESNEVYGIRTQQKNDVILRIGHWDKRTFEREQWAVEQAAVVGVPVPSILAVGEELTSGAPTYYCVQKKLQGTPLDTLLYSSGLSVERAKPIVEKAGEALAKIHSIKTSGWGYLATPKRGEDSTLDDRFAKVVAESDRISAALKATNVRVADITTVLAQLKAGLSIFEGNQRLVHGDFGPKHIFVDEHDDITGIIDWEQVESADPVVEFARWNFWFNKSSPTEWLKTGHERVSKLGDNYDERFRIAQLESAIWTLMYFTYESVVEDCAIRAARAISEATL